MRGRMSGMNVADTRSEMLACVAELRERLAATSDQALRVVLADNARQQIERARKRFKRRIDEKAREQHQVFWIVVRAAGRPAKSHFP